MQMNVKRFLFAYELERIILHFITESVSFLLTA